MHDEDNQAKGLASSFDSGAWNANDPSHSANCGQNYKGGFSLDLKSQKFGIGNICPRVFLNDAVRNWVRLLRPNSRLGNRICV